MNKNLDSASALIAISSLDLASVTGGQGGAELVGRPLPNRPAQPPAPPPPGAQPNLTCPDGTAPNYVRVTGDLNLNLPTVSGRVNGSFEQFSCERI
jgi:hypothetical protein